jgi:hypothetical protein
MKKKRREQEEFSVSFLDVICCGFGAIVLLLMIAKTVEPIVLEDSAIHLDGQVADLQEKLFAIRGETQIYNRDLNAKHEQLSLELERIAILRTEMADLEARYAQKARASSSSDSVHGKLELALQSLTKEMERLLGQNYQRKNDLIGGIPVDSEYIVFIIDTSGSMYANAWPRLVHEVVNILDIYPEVKGIQVLNDMGEYMFPTYRRKWIPDTPVLRKSIVDRLRSWNAYSNSSPVEGIQMAIRTFYESDKKISLYVMGDDLQPGHSITKVAQTVDMLNSRFGKERMVRIHAVGFPVIYQLAPSNQQTSAERFAALMREITHRNGGTFVGLNDYRLEQ